MTNSRNLVAVPVIDIIWITAVVSVLQTGVNTQVLTPPYIAFTETETENSTPEFEEEEKEEDGRSKIRMNDETRGEMEDNLVVNSDLTNTTVLDNNWKEENEIVAFVVPEFFNEEVPEGEFWIVSEYLELLPDEQFYMVRLFIETGSANDTILLEEESS